MDGNNKASHRHSDNDVTANLQEMSNCVQKTNGNRQRKIRLLQEQKQGL